MQREEMNSSARELKSQAMKNTCSGPLQHWQSYGPSPPPVAVALQSRNTALNVA